MKRWDFYFPNVIFAMNEAHNLFKTLKCMLCGVSPSDLSRNMDMNIEECWHETPTQLRFHSKLGQGIPDQSLCIDNS